MSGKQLVATVARISTALILRSFATTSGYWLGISANTDLENLGQSSAKTLLVGHSA